MVSPDTTRDGYYFDGWYESSDFGGERINFPYTLSRTTTIYAKWMKICHVKFESNGGSEVSELNTAILNTMPESTKIGYTLLGWYKEEELQNQIFFPYTINSDSVFYAKWIPNTDTVYKVEHYRQNSALDTNPESFVFAESENLAGKTDALTQAVPKQYEGFCAGSFQQCKIDSDGSTVVKIYYNRKKYTVSFYPNGGLGEIFSQEFHYGCPQKLSASPFSKTDYVFSGWSTSVSEKAVYTDQSEFTAYNDTNLYACWNESKTVSYKVQHFLQTKSLGNDYELVTEDTQSLSGKTGELTQAEPKSYTGFTPKNFSQVIISEKESSGEGCAVNIFYDRNSYTVSFNANDGKGTMEPQLFYYDVAQKLKVNAFEKSGYTFNGWGESEGDFTVYKDEEKITINCDTVLFAQWYYGTTVDSSSVANLSLSELPETFTLKISGKITQNTLIQLAEKIAQTNVDIIVDLSETQGLVTISPANNNKSIFADCKKLTAVILPDSLTTIGSYAFYECKELRKVYIPGNVKTIGAHAFYYCTNLENIELSGTDTIGDYAFYNCNNLKPVCLKDINTIGDSAFSFCENLQTMYLENIETVGNYAFSYLYDINHPNKTIDDITLKNITTIGKYAFGHSTSLTFVNMENITKLEPFAFADCSSLSSISIDAKSIGYGAFKDCSGLTAVIIGKNVEEISNNNSYSVFEGCSVLTSVIFENKNDWNIKYSESYFWPVDVTNAAQNVSELKYSSRTWFRK